MGGKWQFGRKRRKFRWSKRSSGRRRRKRRRSRRRSHLLSAVVGRRNNWFLSPGKLPEQFLIKSTRRHSYYPAEAEGGGAARGAGQS